MDRRHAPRPVRDNDLDLRRRWRRARGGGGYDWHIAVRQIVGEGPHAASWIEFTVTGQEGAEPGLCFFDLGEDGRIIRITDFWPEPSELPASRAHLVERY
jgi:hypothetical protein